MEECCGDPRVIDWAMFKHWLPTFATVMDPRMYTPQWLVGEVWSGRVRFWGNDRAALATELRNYPTGVHDLHFLVAAGDLDEVISTLRPAAERWARDLGCIGAVVESREGWAKALKAEGYRPFQLKVRKDF